MQLYRGIVVIIIATSHSIEVFSHRGFPGLDFLQTRTGGVDFFFTLSGFLIFYAYSKYANNKSAVKAFLARRFLRIYPLLWFFTLLSLPVYLLSSGIGEGNEMQLPFIFGSLLLLPQTVDPILGATWSLSHVVLFYLAFAVYLCWPNFFRVAIGIWITLFFINLIFFFPNSKHDSFQVWQGFIFSPFNIEFLAGAFLAKLATENTFQFGKTAVMFGTAAFIAIWWSATRTLSPVLLTTIFCTASLLLIYGGVAIDNHHSVTLPKIANMIGDASYAIIIVNLPVIVAFSRIYEKLSPGVGISAWGSWPGVIFAVATAIAAGVFTHRVIEPRLLTLIKKALPQRYAGQF